MLVVVVVWGGNNRGWGKAKTRNGDRTAWPKERKNPPQPLSHTHFYFPIHPQYTEGGWEGFRSVGDGQVDLTRIRRH